MGNIIFFAGIHGVGKTYLAQKIEKNLGIPRYLASKLISSKRKVDYRINKKVDDIALNQNLLFEALKERNLFDKVIILEGHFCLLNKHGEIERIPCQVFQELNLRAIVLIFEEPTKIIQRFNNRGMEDFDLNFIEKFQKEEIDYAKEIATELNVPLIIEKSSEFEEDIIKELIKWTALKPVTVNRIISNGEL